MHQIAQLNARFELWTSQRATYFTKHSSFAFFDHYFNQFPILLLCECLKLIFDKYIIIICSSYSAVRLFDCQDASHFTYRQSNPFELIL